MAGGSRRRSLNPKVIGHTEIVQDLRKFVRERFGSTGIHRHLEIHTNPQRLRRAECRKPLRAAITATRLTP
jgi:hypothetical protein